MLDQQHKGDRIFSIWKEAGDMLTSVTHVIDVATG